MSRARLHRSQLACLVVLWALAVLPGLGSSSRLTYHEALVAQGAREILATGDWSYPTIGGLPWLEKPPLPWWLVAFLGSSTGQVTETVSRLPSALAAAALALAVAVFAARHYGPHIGLLAGSVQTTTAWTVMRGRLAEADVLLACLVAWTMVAFDRLWSANTAANENAGTGIGHKRWHGARWAFFTLLGSSALVKGIGFGAVLIVLIVSIILVWQWDRTLLRQLWLPAGWISAGVLALAWPVVMVMRHGPAAVTLWTTHFTDRLAAHQSHGPFASEPWWEYVPSVLGQGLPWSPLALVGAWRSLGRAVRGNSRSGPIGVPTETVVGAVDRLLWAWSAGPLILLSLAAVRNAHYTVCTQVPWSIWAALELVHLGNAFCRHRWSRLMVRQTVKVAIGALALAYGVSFWLLVPRFDRRGMEWAFYESVSRQVAPNMPLALLYDDWDRNPYDSPFGSLPHDLAVRLFYLGRQACWHTGTASLTAHVHPQEVMDCSPCQGRGPAYHVATKPRASVPGPTENSPVHQIAPAFAVIGRDRDLPGLARLGRVEILDRGPSLRRDRTYTLFRVTLPETAFGSAIPIARAGTADLTPHE
jgi:4-amino-4-deoxy-L-arabinose transferase-like glycosyltransferase